MTKVAERICILVFVFTLFFVSSVGCAQANYTLPNNVCFSLNVSSSSSITANGICQQLGYSGCANTDSLSADLYSDAACATSVTTTVSGNSTSCTLREVNNGSSTNAVAMKITGGTLTCVVPPMEIPMEGWSTTISPENVPGDLERAVMNITNYVLGFIVIIATAAVIYGGIQYLVSAGDEDKISKAKKTVYGGIIGMIIAGLSYGMVIVISTVILRNY